MFGSAIGSGPHAYVEQSAHAPVLYVCVAGASSSGRKGTSAAIARRLVGRADPDWEQCIASGLVSGEGIIHAVRDGKTSTGESDSSDPVDRGVRDKRLFLLESEFARVLAGISRQHSTLSPVLRTLWDDGSARTLGKQSPERTTGAHVALLSHITQTELRRRLSDLEIASGFANRILFVMSRRSKCLPRGDGIPDDDIERLAGKLRLAINRARRVGRIELTEDAWEHWGPTTGR
jgi:hypothetical protein